MLVHVSSRSQVSKITSQVGATHVLSLCDPGKRPWLHPSTPSKNWKLFVFEDTFDPEYDRSPKREQIEDILNWAKTLPNDTVLLVHCEGGISRSTAVALAILTQYHGNDNISKCIDLLIGARPEALPNSLILKYADEILSCNGCLIDAGDKIVNSKVFSKF